MNVVVVMERSGGKVRKSWHDKLSRGLPADALITLSPSRYRFPLLDLLQVPNV